MTVLIILASRYENIGVPRIKVKKKKKVFQKKGLRSRGISNCLTTKTQAKGFIGFGDSETKSVSMGAAVWFAINGGRQFCLEWTLTVIDLIWKWKLARVSSSNIHDSSTSHGYVNSPISSKRLLLPIKSRVMYNGQIVPLRYNHENLFEIRSYFGCSLLVVQAELL